MEHSAPNIGTWQTARRQRKQNNFCSREQQRGNKQRGPQLFFFWSLLFCDFVIKRMGSDLQTMDSWFISTAGPCGRCSFFSQRHMQIPTVPPLSLHNCRLFRQQKEAHLCACVCVCARGSVSVRAAYVLVRVQPYFKR